VKSNRPSPALSVGKPAIVFAAIAVVIGLLPLAIALAQKRDKQIKDLLNGRQIAIALKDFAIDHGGAFPNKEPDADYAFADDLTSADKSNDAFWWLFPTYLTHEDIFTVPDSVWSPSLTDNRLDTAGSAVRSDTLRPGQCAYLYVAGLKETSNPEFPLLADAGTAEDVTVYTRVPNEKGGVWRGKKAIILFVDGSGRIVPVDDRTNPAAAFVKRPGHGYNIFDNSASTAADPWLTPANLILAPE
jgi:hypothetical protein